ncbi:MAG: prenyltransferase [Candidatus Omnitrophota bacterium]
MVRNIIRALRLPFLSASIIPFVFGSLIVRSSFNVFAFIYGFLAVLATHLSANLINDYADSKSGADWQDRNFYKFFGGSKLIQENILTDKFYLLAALALALIAGICVILLSLALRNFLAVWVYAAIITLSWSYSEKPLQFSYHGWGELFIFILFGPALVMGGYFIQTGIFPDLKSFMLALPFGFLTTAVLFANEVPDFLDDQKAGKFTWVSISGPSRAFLFYYLLIGLAFLSILLNVILGFLGVWALFSFVCIIPAHKAAVILKEYPFDKARLIESSKLAIAAQSFASLILIAGVIL